MIYQRPIPVSRIGHDAVANGSAADRAYVFLAPRGGLRREAVSRYCRDRNGSKRIRPCGGRGVGAMRGLLLTWLALIALGGGAEAADVSASMPTKAPPQTAPGAYDWTGFYAGVHSGYAAGSSHWSATQSGAAAPLSGSLDMLNAYDPFTATGGYLHGFQAGYNYVLPSHVVVGAEADIFHFQACRSHWRLRHSPRHRAARPPTRIWSNSPARCARASATPLVTGYSTPLAALPTVTTSLPAPVVRHAGRRHGAARHSTILSGRLGCGGRRRRGARAVAEMDGAAGVSLYRLWLA